MQKRALFIVIEGIDYSGKSTIARTIIEECKDKKILYLDGLPEGVSRAEKRKADNGSVEERFEFYWKKVNKRLSEIIETSLPEYDIIICVRYYISTMTNNIYVEERTGKHPHYEEHDLEGIIQPDAVIFCRVDEETLKSRMKESPPEQQYESNLNSLLSAQEEFERLIELFKEKYGYKRIDIDTSQTSES